ncbi:Crp/Fnr family transcriptional regulator [Hanstruepera flava]|uniref:Crp/Fnr family transcriptional regulator n=1 Tax=Hanstruepera flava TaxID=2930218 RepID=UPI0020277AE4|nr:cyclic nucleotide-binding domain-containing protein [Hanstruepera flava]
MSFSKSEIKQLVKKYFPYLKNKEIDIFLKMSTYEVYDNKDIILKGGRTDKFLFLILKGSSRAYSIDEKGQELNCHLRAEGYFFGDARVFEDKEQILNAEAIGETHILKFNIDALEKKGYQNPKIMAFYINILKEVIAAFSHRIHTFVAMTSEERYLDLIDMNPDYLKSTFDKHIASFLGIKPLTLHRIKKKLKIIK